MHLVVCFQSTIGPVLHGVSWCYDNPNNNRKSSRVNSELGRHDVVIEAWCLCQASRRGV